MGKAGEGKRRKLKKPDRKKSSVHTDVRNTESGRISVSCLSMFIPACRRHFPLSCHSDRLCLLWHAEKTHQNTHQAPDCSPLALRCPDICTLPSFRWEKNGYRSKLESEVRLQCSHAACWVLTTGITRRLASISEVIYSQL